MTQNTFICQELYGFNSEKNKLSEQLEDIVTYDLPYIQ